MIFLVPETRHLLTEIIILHKGEFLPVFVLVIIMDAESSTSTFFQYSKFNVDQLYIQCNFNEQKLRFS